MEDVGIFYGHLVYFVAIWCILWLFGMFSPVLVCCTKKNLATLFITVASQIFFTESSCDRFSCRF
jgi:Na+/H+-dicarboxylate symporter